jgi:hypothetical protein
MAPTLLENFSSIDKVQNFDQNQIGQNSNLGSASSKVPLLIY